MNCRRPIVTDHALLRFLERAGALQVEQLRDAIAASLERAASAALDLGQRGYTIKADGLVYVVVDSKVVTIMVEHDGPQPAKLESAGG